MSPNDNVTPARRNPPSPPPPALRYGCTIRLRDKAGRYGFVVKPLPSGIAHVVLPGSPNVGSLTPPSGGWTPAARAGGVSSEDAVISASATVVSDTVGKPSVIPIV